MKNMRFSWAAIAVALLAAGCGYGRGELASQEPDANAPPPLRDRAYQDNQAGRLFGPDGFFLVGGNNRPSSATAGAAPELGVNAYLWRASLDTLSFLPLASTDPFGGVITTDWGSAANAPNERFKVTAYVKGPELIAESLSVTVNKQVRGPGGVWTAAPVAPAVVSQLEDAVLTRARQLRVEGFDD